MVTLRQIENHCNIFNESPLHAARKLVPEQNLCLNCLGSHFVKYCFSRITSEKCQHKHHTVLHDKNIQARKRSFQSISKKQLSPQQQLIQTSLGASQNSPPLPYLEVTFTVTTPLVTFEFTNVSWILRFLNMFSECRYHQKDREEEHLLLFHQISKQRLIGGFHQSHQTPVHSVKIKIHPFGNNYKLFIINNSFVVDLLNLNSAETETVNSFVNSINIVKTSSLPIIFDNSVTVHLGQDNFDLNTTELVIKRFNNSRPAIQLEL